MTLIDNQLSTFESEQDERLGRFIGIILILRRIGVKKNIYFDPVNSWNIECRQNQTFNFRVWFAIRSKVGWSLPLCPCPKSLVQKQKQLISFVRLQKTGFLIIAVTETCVKSKPVPDCWKLDSSDSNFPRVGCANRWLQNCILDKSFLLFLPPCWPFRLLKNLLGINSLSWNFLWLHSWLQCKQPTTM